MNQHKIKDEEYRYTLADLIVVACASMGCTGDTLFKSEILGRKLTVL
jgi:hypothetical protein